MSHIPSEQELLDLASEILEVETVQNTDSWFGLGGDSLTALQFSVLLEETWGLVVDVLEVTDAESLGALHDQLSAARER